MAVLRTWARIREVTTAYPLETVEFWAHKTGFATSTMRDKLEAMGGVNKVRREALEKLITELGALEVYKQFLEKVG